MKEQFISEIRMIDGRSWRFRFIIGDSGLELCGRNEEMKYGSTYEMRYGSTHEMKDEDTGHWHSGLLGDRIGIVINQVDGVLYHVQTSTSFFVDRSW
jgi:hypothetical protein